MSGLTHIGSQGAQRILRLELVLLLGLLVSALGAGCGLLFLKRQHDRQARLAATATVLDRGAALLETLTQLGATEMAEPTPERWRRFSGVVDSALAVRRDVQSISLSRNGEIIFQRQADGLLTSATDTAPGADSESAPEISQAVQEINGRRQAVFVMKHERPLPDGGRLATEVTFRREEVGAQERTARDLVSSLFYFSIAVLVLSFGACAAILLLAVARDRQREQRARQEEHLAFSGVLANGILHDFRNPMSAVLLDAQMLEREMRRADGFRPPRVNELAGRIVRAMGRMDKVFQEFLFLARPDSERPGSLDLIQIARECADILTPRAEQAGVAVKIHEPGHLPEVEAYPFALRRALLNIMLNAIQFAPPGSAVELRFGSRSARVYAEVQDRGAGIPPERRREIFEMFVTGRPEGTGLGLFLARTAVRRCGGELEALEREGGGARLRLTLNATKERSLTSREPTTLIDCRG